MKMVRSDSSETPHWPKAWVLFLELTHRAQGGNGKSSFGAWFQHAEGMVWIHGPGFAQEPTWLCFKTSLLRYRTQCCSSSILVLKALVIFFLHFLGPFFRLLLKDCHKQPLYFTFVRIKSSVTTILIKTTYILIKSLHLKKMVWIIPRCLQMGNPDFNLCEQLEPHTT